MRKQRESICYCCGQLVYIITYIFAHGATPIMRKIADLHQGNRRLASQKKTTNKNNFTHKILYTNHLPPPPILKHLFDIEKSCNFAIYTIFEIINRNEIYEEKSTIQLNKHPNTHFPLPAAGKRERVGATMDR
ncbi:MAG: hypothetical protein MJZ51_02470 [Bacteroidales bacterium]|nr:hypothetical protein [Bacteroidales bacterium]